MPPRAAGIRLLYKTRAVILRRRELGEHDLLLTLLTADRGKLQAVGRSSRKVTARLMGKLEPTLEVDLTLAQGKSLDVVTDVRVRAPQVAIRSDLERLACATVLLELFDVVLDQAADSPEAYPLLAAALNLLEHGADGAMALRWCEIRLVAALGIQPDMDGCVVCAGARPAGGFFSVPQGGLLCERCAPADDDAWRLLAGTVALYRQLRSAPAERVPRLSTEPAVARQLEEVMRGHLSYRWPHRLKSLSFLRRVEGLRNC